MTYIEQAIKDAVEKGGWKPWETMTIPKGFTLERLDFDRFAIYNSEGDRWGTIYERRAWIDPSFWQALWKAKGHQLIDLCGTDIKKGEWLIPEWQYQWLQFILHLAEEKYAESFFAEILK